MQLPHKLRAWAAKLDMLGDTPLVLLAALVGLAGGFASIIFHWLIEFFTRLSLHDSRSLLAFLGRFYVVVPAVTGGLLVGLLCYFLAREAKGHGVPEVMLAIARRGGLIDPRVPAVKAVASAVTIGSGGSAGPEGPIVQIAAGLGSLIGQFFKMSEARIKTLVGCGAAAGIAAIFNAPVGGVLFALEVVLGEFSVSAFSMMVISAVTAAAVARVYLGDQPAFQAPAYHLVSAQELFLYALLGILSALVAVLYIRLLYQAEDLFARLHRLPEYVRPALGGVMFGLVGVFVPLSMGAGDTGIESALYEKLPLVALASLALLKIVTTAITLGSGGSGGVFAPGLFIGAMTGGAFGALVHRLYPAVTASPGAYALVGMGAVFAASTHAPMTGIIILFEITHDYRIILPLMISTVTGTLLAARVSPATIYTTNLLRRGIDIRAGKDVNLMRSILVREAMCTRINTVRDDMKLRDVIRIMQETRHNGFPVLDASGQLCGVITLDDIRKTKLEGRLETPVKDVMTTDLVVTTPLETLNDVSPKFAFRDVGRLPVVDPSNPRRLVGILTRSDIIKAYNRRLLEPSANPGPSAVAEAKRSDSLT